MTTQQLFQLPNGLNAEQEEAFRLLVAEVIRLEHELRHVNDNKRLLLCEDCNRVLAIEFDDGRPADIGLLLCADCADVLDTACDEALG